MQISSCIQRKCKSDGDQKASAAAEESRYSNGEAGKRRS